MTALKLANNAPIAAVKWRNLAIAWKRECPRHHVPRLVNRTESTKGKRFLTALFFCRMREGLADSRPSQWQHHEEQR